MAKVLCAAEYNSTDYIVDAWASSSLKSQAIG